VLGNRELFGRLATEAMLAGMEDAWRAWVPDLVLRDPTEYASAVLAARDTNADRPGRDLTGRGGGRLDRRGRPRTGGPPPRLGVRAASSALPDALPSVDRPVTLRGHGPISRASRNTRLAAGLVARLERAADLHDLGTVLGYMSIAAETYRMALEAVKRTNARVLLTVGRRFDASILGPVPPNVHLEPWINQARVLDHADLVVCHGGSGTTLAALAAGVPLVIVPLFADQFENARRIGATRAGRVVETQIRTGTAEATQSLGANTSFRTTFSRVRLSRVDDWLPEPRRNETKRDEADSLR
jgi:hypothetical protein